MKALLRLALGGLLGAVVVAGAWAFGWVDAPESVVRRVVIFSTLYPVPRDDVSLRAIECPPLRPARLFVVCTQGCDAISRIVLLRGLQATLLVDQGRLPPESESVARQRINTVIRAQHLTLDLASAREMIACYLRMEGYSPDLVLPPDGESAVEAAREAGPGALDALVDRLEASRTLERIEVRAAGDGFEGTMLYWDTAGQGNPILRLGIRLGRNGEVRAVSSALFTGPS